MGARRFLSSNHKWQSNKRDFHGKVERRSAPEILSGKDVLNQLLTLEDMKFGKTPKNGSTKKVKAFITGGRKASFSSFLIGKII